MKRSRSAWAVLVPIAAVAFLGGCASVASNQTTTVVDSVMVSRVEHAARQMGTTVIWVNYPTRTVTASAQPAVAK